MKDFHETVKAKIAENGNKDISQKELLWYLVAKVDDVSARIHSGEGRIGACETNSQRNLDWIKLIMGAIVLDTLGLVYALILK